MWVVQLGTAKFNRAKRLFHQYVFFIYINPNKAFIYRTTRFTKSGLILNPSVTFVYVTLVMSCPVTVDLTMDDDSDTDSCVAEVAAYIRSTPARPPSSNEIVDLTVTPLPVSPRTETLKSSAMHAHRITDYFSGGPLSPTKKVYNVYLG